MSSSSDMRLRTPIRVMDESSSRVSSATCATNLSIEG